MPKTLVAPLPHAQATAPPRTDKQAWRTFPMESRVLALEARWEETIPTLAKIADLRGVENRLIKWVLGAAFGLLFAILGIFFSGYTSLNARLDSAVSDLRAENRSAIADLKEDTRAAIADLKEDTRVSIAELRTEIRETNSRMDAKFDALMAELRSQRNDVR